MSFYDIVAVVAQFFLLCVSVMYMMYELAFSVVYACMWICAKLVYVMFVSKNKVKKYSK